MIISRCPGSCGELIQGIIHGKEQLISYPIDCYSYVKLSEGKGENRDLYPKAYRAVEEVFKYFGEDGDQSKNIKLDIHSQIPYGKGMASSTADLGATILATATYLGKSIDQKAISRICISIEPTDSTIFSQMALYDYLKGEYIKKYSQEFQTKVLVLEGQGEVDTLEFEKMSKKEILVDNAPIIQKAFEKIEKGIKNQDKKSIGQGAIESALAHEKILSKPGLECIVDKALKHGAYGVNVAHSGTVLGILFDHPYFDQEAFIQSIKKEDFMAHYLSIKEYEIIQGGAEIVHGRDYLDL